MTARLCRMCGCNNNLKLKYLIYRGNNELLQMLNLCTDIKIDVDDNLPKYLCEECEIGLKFAYKLRKKSEETNKLLQQRLLIPNSLSSEQTVIGDATDDVKLTDQLENDSQKSIQLEDSQKEVCTIMKHNYEENLEIIQSINDDDFQTYFDEEYIENEDNKDIFEEYIIDEADENVIDDSSSNNLNISQIRTVIDVETGNLYMVEENPNDNSAFLKETENSKHSDELNMEMKRICKICQKEFGSLRAFDSHCKTHNASIKEKSPNYKSKSKECVTSVEPKTDVDERNSTNELIADGLVSYVCFPNNYKHDDAEEFEIIEELTIGQKFNSEQIKKETSAFICEICDKVFVRAHALAAHAKIHQVDNVLKKHLTSIKLRSDNDNKNDTKLLHLANDWKSITIMERLKGKLCYKCKICSKYNKCRNQHIKHCWIHTGEKPFNCHCGRSFRSLNGFNFHREIHSEEKNFKCDKCFAVFSYKISLSIHKKTKHHIINHKCNYCKKKFIKYSSLQVHLLSHKNIFMFQCDYCDKKFKKKIGKRSHEIKEHSQESKKRFNLDCDSQFNKQSDRTDHLNSCKKIKRKLLVDESVKDLNNDLAKKKSINNKSKYCCDVCGKICRDSGAFAIHQNVHVEKKFKCSICNLNFRYRYSLTIHMRIHTGEQPYQCNFCDLRFAKLEALKIHLVDHVANESNISSISNNATISETENKQNDDSNKQEIVRTSEKPFICSLCSKQYLRYKSYLKHISNHDKKKYECKICGSGFNYPTHYKQHMYIHSDERPHTCHVCKKGFRSAWNLKAHLQKHTGSKPVTCDICGHHFSRMQSLKLHKYQHIKHLLIDPMDAAQEGLQINISSDIIINDTFKENTLNNK